MKKEYTTDFIIHYINYINRLHRKYDTDGIHRKNNAKVFPTFLYNLKNFLLSNPEIKKNIKSKRFAFAHENNQDGCFMISSK